MLQLGKSLASERFSTPKRAEWGLQRGEEVMERERESEGRMKKGGRERLNE